MYCLGHKLSFDMHKAIVMTFSNLRSLVVTGHKWSLVVIKGIRRSEMYSFAISILPGPIAFILYA